MENLDIGSIVRIAGDSSGTLLCVRSIAGCEYIVTDPEGGLHTLPRSELILVPVSELDEAAPADTADDQFTGADLGADMAKAEV